MDTNAVRELTLEEMIELGYDARDIQAKLERKLAKRDSDKKKERQVKAREVVVSAIKDYLTVLGVPAEQLDRSTLDVVLQSFEKEIEPALKVFNAMPKKKNDRSTLDDAALESAFGTLRAFADSL